MPTYFDVGEALVEISIQSCQFIQEAVATGSLTTQNLGQKEVGEWHIHYDTLKKSKEDMSWQPSLQFHAKATARNSGRLISPKDFKYQELGCDSTTLMAIQSTVPLTLSDSLSSSM